MTLAQFSLISSIVMLLVVGNPEAANITMALAANAPMPAKEIGTSLRRKNTIPCCGASEGSFRQITQAVPFQKLLSTKRFCLCKLVENGLGGSEGCFTEATRRFVLWSSSAAFVDGAEALKKPCYAKPCTCTTAAPSFGSTAQSEMKAIASARQCSRS